VKIGREEERGEIGGVRAKSRVNSTEMGSSSSM